MMLHLGCTVRQSVVFVDKLNVYSQFGPCNLLREVGGDGEGGNDPKKVLSPAGTRCAVTTAASLDRMGSEERLAGALCESGWKPEY